MGAPRWNIPSTGYNVESCSHARGDVAVVLVGGNLGAGLLPRTRGCCHGNFHAGSRGFVAPTHAGMLRIECIGGCSHARGDVARNPRELHTGPGLLPRTQGCCGQLPIVRSSCRVVPTHAGMLRLKIFCHRTSPVRVRPGA